ncbi:Uncharacterised protein [Vibrio cholerae]|nr:Uncharacterised protein [Vibrio cholerae]
MVSSAHHVRHCEYVAACSVEHLLTSNGLATSVLA